MVGTPRCQPIRQLNPRRTTLTPGDIPKASDVQYFHVPFVVRGHCERSRCASSPDARAQAAPLEEGSPIEDFRD